MVPYFGQVMSAFAFCPARKQGAKVENCKRDGEDMFFVQRIASGKGKVCDREQPKNGRRRGTSDGEGRGKHNAARSCRHSFTDPRSPGRRWVRVLRKKLRRVPFEITAGNRENAKGDGGTSGEARGTSSEGALDEQFVPFDAIFALEMGKNCARLLLACERRGAVSVSLLETIRTTR
ncbi:hypothetical protein TRVL_03849 [Trypanosoma vivax]|nr:hypothetical protein TRVL_03849 [Trypanosoma vivax]